MPIFQTPPISDNPLIRNIGHDELTASWGEWGGMVGQRALDYSLTFAGQRTAELDYAEGIPVPLADGLVELNPEESPHLTPQEWQESPYARKGLSFPDGVKESVASILAERYDYRQRLADIETRKPKSWLTVPAELAISLGASLLDPLNVAAAFVPVVGEARYATMLAKIGKWPARLATGAIEGAAGMAMIEPVITAAKLREQDDYKFLDSLLNIGFGAVFGAGLHSLSGAAKDLWGRFHPQAREANLKTAVSQLADGREVDLKALVEIADNLETARAKEDLKLYHGTSTPFEKFDVEYLDEGALYGPGIYLTENPSIASGYALKGKGEAPNIRPVTLRGKNFLDLDIPLPKAVLDAVIKEWNYDAESLELLREAARARARTEGGTPEITGHDLYVALQTTGERGDSYFLSNFLKEQGYDGLTHIGGKGKEPHRVWIAFNPDQVVPYFSKTPADITKTFAPEARTTADPQASLRAERAAKEFKEPQIQADEDWLLAQTMMRDIQETLQSETYVRLEPVKRIGITPESIRADYGAGAVQKLQQKLPGLIKKTGMPLDVLAADYGFGSADELYQLLTSYKSKKQITQELGREGTRQAYYDSIYSGIDDLREQGMLTEADIKTLENAHEEIQRVDDYARVVDAAALCLNRKG